MKSGTLQSIRSIAGSQSADESLVRFNRFTGKAIVMGSSGSRFGLVSWVRKLYTTSSDKKIQKFLMDGIAKEHKNTVGLGKSWQGKLASGTLQLRTVRDLRRWNKQHQSLIPKKGSPNVTVVSNTVAPDIVPDITEVLNEVAVLMKKFNETSRPFVKTVSYEKYMSFCLLSDFQTGAHVSEQPSRKANQVKGQAGARLYGSFPEDNKRVYHTAVLQSVSKSLKSQSMSNDIPSDLSAYVKATYTRTASGPRKNAVTAKAVAEDCFHQWLNGKFVDECRACETQLSSLAQEDANIDLMSPEEGNAIFSYRKNLGTRVRGLLDTHYSTKGGEAPSEEVKGKALFREELRKSATLREETETALKTTYLKHNTNFGKTIYSAKFLNHLFSWDMNQGQRGQALDATLLDELNLQYLIYCAKEQEKGTGGLVAL